ncbi:helix-turn-helix domain-containing protein [Priestia megaterium]
MLTHVELGERLRDARKSSGITQQDAADKLEISRQKLSNVEKGQGPLDTLLLANMANLYGYSIDSLINSSESDDTEIKLAFRSEELSEEDQEVINWSRKVLINIKQIREICEAIN